MLKDYMYLLYRKNIDTTDPEILANTLRALSLGGMALARLLIVHSRIRLFRPIRTQALDNLLSDLKSSAKRANNLASSLGVAEDEDDDDDEYEYDDEDDDFLLELYNETVDDISDMLDDMYEKNENAITANANITQFNLASQYSNPTKAVYVQKAANATFRLLKDYDSTFETTGTVNTPVRIVIKNSEKKYFLLFLYIC